MWRILLKIIRRVLVSFLVLAAIGAVLTAAFPQGRTSVRAALLATQLLPDIPVKPQTWFTGAPTRREVTYPLSTSSGVADLYEPSGDGTHAAVLLFLGVNPAGRDDERVVRLAEGLARSGLVVMIPWSDTMTQKRIAVEEVDNIVRAFQYMRGLDRVDPDRAGMGGLCVGASIATVAAQDSRIRDGVRFLNFFGGYFDVLDLMKAVASRSRFYNGRVEPWAPDKLTQEVFTAQLVESVDDPGDRELLKRRYVAGETEIVIDAGSLTPGARAVQQLLSGPSAQEAERLLTALPEEFLASMRSVSPSTNIGDLHARVLIMHDREDELVPSEESRRLADALESGGGAYYTEFSFFDHVDPTASVGPVTFVREAFKLYRHLYNVLRAADG